MWTSEMGGLESLWAFCERARMEDADTACRQYQISGKVDGLDRQADAIAGARS